MMYAHATRRRAGRGGPWQGRSMPRQSPRQLSHPTAFTLVEVLVALTLTAVVLTLTARIAVQTVDAERRLQASQTEQMRTTFPFDALAADLDARIPDRQDVTICLDANHRPRLEMTCLVAEHGRDLHTSRVPAAVIYRLMRMEGSADHLRWLRQTRPLMRGSRSTTSC